MRHELRTASSFVAGYTLLELLISISLIAIILLIIGGAMRLGFRSADSGERKMESLERFKTSLNIMDSQIQSVFIAKAGAPDDPGRKYFFKGARDSMEFPTNCSIWGGQRGYIVVRYKVETDSNGKHSLSAAEGFAGAGQGKQIKLFNAVDSIYFEYFFKNTLEEKGKWVEQWTDQESMPKMVRITLTDKYGEFALIIPVRAGNSPDGQVLQTKDL